MTVKILKFIPCILFLLSLIACGPSQEDMARAKVNNAKVFLQNNDTTSALLQLDSATRFYPKALYSANAAKNLKQEILWAKMQNMGAELERVKKQVVEFEQNFEKEKTEYDRYTQYIHKRQNFDRRWDKSFLRINLDERGEISLTSNYFGETWLNHTGLRVYDGPAQAKTQEVALGSPDNHHSDFMESKWEKVTYRNGKDNGVIEFIANNTNLRLKAVFLGERNYYIILEDYDKTAAQEALLLSKALKRKISLQAEIKKTQAILNAE